MALKKPVVMTGGQIEQLQSGDSINEYTITFTIGDSSAITTGGKDRTRIIVPKAGTIVRWKLISDQNTNATIDVWKANGSIPTNANTITASAKPSLSGASINSSSTLTGWTTTVAEDDVFIMEVEANSAATQLTLVLVIQ